MMAGARHARQAIDDRAKLIAAGRKAGMSDAALIRAGMRREDLAPTKRPEKPKPWKAASAPTIPSIVAHFVYEANQAGVMIVPHDLTSSGEAAGARQRGQAGPRMVAMWLVRTILGEEASFPAIGRYFGGRDHSTVMHAFNEGASNHFERSPVMREIAEKVRARFTKGG